VVELEQIFQLLKDILVVDIPHQLIHLQVEEDLMVQQDLFV